MEKRKNNVRRIPILVMLVFALCVTSVMMLGFPVTASAAEDNNYIAADGTSVAIPADATTVSSSDTAWNAGWYVVDSNVEIKSIQFELTGDVHLVLKDGCTLNITGCLYVGSGSLYIYGQSGGTGTLTVQDTGTGSYNTVAIYVYDDLIIYGGTVNAGAIATTSTGAAVGIGATNIFVNGGTVNVTATAASNKACGIEGKTTISGGTMTLNAAGKDAENTKLFAHTMTVNDEGTLVLPSTMNYDEVAALGITGTGSLKFGDILIRADGNCISHQYENGLCTVCRYSDTPAVDSDGDGYLEIDSAAKLWWFTHQVKAGQNDLNAELTANIDLSGTCGEGIGNWLPISHEEGYAGKFNGQGFTVSNLYIASDEQYAGFFGYVRGGTVENVTVTGNVSSTFYSTYDENYNFYDGVAGGVVAHLDGGAIRNCESTVTVTGGYYFGGICGQMLSGNIADCINRGTIICFQDSTNQVEYGGIVGFLSDGTVRGCINHGEVTVGTRQNYVINVGGIVGRSSYGTIENCINISSIVGSYTSTGGIVGKNWVYATVRNCGNLGTVIGDYAAGGITGSNEGIIEHCWNVAAVSGTSEYVGPIAGYISTNYGDITNNYYLSDTTTEDGGRTAEQFASGQVTYELNGSTTTDESVWKQTLGSDSYPTLTGELVYYITPKMCNGTELEPIYSNSSEIVYHDDTNDDGFCDLCNWLIISEKTFPDEEFRNIILSAEFDMNQDGLLSTEEIARVTNLWLEGGGFTDLTGINYFTELTELDAQNNNFTSLDLSGLTKLESLYLNANPNLESLNLTGCTALQYLYVNNNSLTTLDVSQNKALVTLNCGENQLAELDVSQNTELIELMCLKNLFTSLDLSANEKLEQLNCYGCTNLTSLKLGTAIVKIDVANTALRSLDLSACSQLEFLDYNNANLTSLELPAHFLLDNSGDGHYNYISQIWLDIDQKTMVLDLRDFVVDVSRIVEVSPNATLVGNYLYISNGETQVYYEYDTGAAEGAYPHRVSININNSHTHGFDKNAYCAGCGLQATIRVDAFEEKCFFTSSFADALALASEGTADAPRMPAFITLFADVTVDEAVTMTGGDVRLELNGKTLTFTYVGGNCWTVDGATVTIDDTSTEKTGKIHYSMGGNNTNFVIALRGASLLTIENGTFDFAKVYSIDVRGGSTVIQNGGLIKRPIFLDEAKYVLNGGEIDVDTYTVFHFDSNGGSYYEIEINGGTVSVDDSNCIGGLIVYEFNSGEETLTITGGRFINKASKPFIISFVYDYVDFNLNGGSFESGLVIKAESIIDNLMTPAYALAEGYAFYDADGNPVALTEDQTEIAGYVTVGECTHIIDFNTGKCNACGDKQYLLGYEQDGKYYYFDDFITAMAEIDEINMGPNTAIGTIKLYADITVNETVTVLAVDPNHLDLNGKTLKFVSTGDICWIISEDSNVILRDSSTEKTGKVIFDMTAAPTCAGVTVEGNLQIDYGTIEAIGGYALAVSGEVLNHGTINGSILMQNGGKYKMTMHEASVNTTDEVFVIDENASEWTINLINGTFENGIKVGEPLTLKDILPIGGAFGDEEGNYIDLTEGQREITGKVTLIACPHQSKYLRLNSNDNGTHDMVCTFCDEIISANEECSYQRYIKSSMLISHANCTSPEIYYMSCACGHKNGETFEDGYTDPNVHTGEETELISNHDGTHNVVHSCCKAVITENASCIPADCTTASLCDCGYSMEATHTEHDFSGAYSYNDEYHWNKCQNCNEMSERDYHYGQNSGDCTKPTLCECGYVVIEAKEHSSIATFYTDDYHYEGCLICTMPVDDVRTPHDFSIPCHDEYDHWYQCSGCQKETEHIQHSGVNSGDCTKDSICSCEYVTKTGETAHDFSGEYLSDADGHYHKCENCDVIDEKLAHTPEADDWTCLTAVLCSACGYETTKGQIIHDFNNANLYDSEGHWHKCSRCDQTDAKLDHSFTVAQNDGTHHWNKCEECEAIDEKIAHTFNVLEKDSTDHWNKCSGCDAIDTKVKHSATEDGDCTTEEKCSCGTVVIEAKNDHAFDNSCDTTCGNKGCTHTREITHTPRDDDGDCTTAIHCAVCDAMTTPGNASHSFDNSCDTDCNREGCNHIRTITHTPNADDGNCLTEVLCSICNAVTTEAKNEHGFDNDCDTTCGNKGCTHTREITHTPREDDGDCTTAIHCVFCDAMTTPGNASHSFDNDCDTDCNRMGCDHIRTITHTPDEDDGSCLTEVRCSICNAVTTPANEAHTGGTATCQAKANCSVCGTAYGELASHSFTVTQSDKNQHWNKCANCEETDTKADHTDSDSNHECDICDAWLSPFEKVSLSLGDDLAVNYFIAKGNFTDPQIRFTINGYTKTVDGILVDEQFKFVFDGVAPQWIGDTITAELIIGGEVVEIKEYSVLKYLNTLKAKTAAELGISEAKYTTMQTLIADLLVYGGAAQTYTDHNTGALVSEGITGSTFKEIGSTDASKKDGSYVTFKGATVFYDSVNTLRFKFESDDLTGVVFKIKVNNGPEETVEYVNIGDNTYTITTAAIFADRFDDVYTVTAYKDGVADATLTYSVKSYVYSKQDGTDNIAALAKATYNYGISAKAYKDAE